MKTIYKYPLKFGRSPLTIQMPAYADIISVQNQNWDIVAWAIVDPAQPLVDRRFHLFDTGQLSENIDKLLHLTTVQLGTYVAHVFEEPRCACSPPCIPWHNSAKSST